MKLNNLLFGIFSFIALSGYSQIQEKKIKATTASVTEFHLKTTNIDELKSFDWTTINEVFENNDRDEILTLAFEYENPSKKRNSKPNLKNLKFEVTGTTRELPDLIEKSKKMISKFLEINETYN